MTLTILMIISVLAYSAIGITVSTIYLKQTYYKNAKFLDELLKHKLYIFLIIVIYAMLSYVTIHYSVDHHWSAILRITKWLTIIWGCFILTCTDIKERIIPNKVLAALLVIRAVYLVVEIIIAFPYLKEALGYPIIGAVVGGGIIALAMFVSRHGVGAGDVKLFFVIGAFVGSTQIISVLLYTFLVSAVAGVVLLVLQKVKLKDSVPLAPFAFMGVVLDYFLLVIGG